MWVWMGEGCWAGDVGVALVGAIMCPGKSIQPRSRYVMDHQGSTAKQLHPRRLVTPGIDLHRSRPFNDTAASLAHIASASSSLTPHHAHHALRVYLLPIVAVHSPAASFPL